MSLNFKHLVSGKKHYTLLNDENVIVSFGDFLKTNRGQEELDGFAVHYGKELFDE